MSYIKVREKTRKQSIAIERIQKLALKIILQEDYLNYKNACNVFSADTLEVRRKKLCLKFATKNLKSEIICFPIHKSDFHKEVKETK